MTEERFTVDDLNIQDNSPKGSLYLLEEQGGVNALCNLINGLNTKTNRLEKENEQLKSTINEVTELLSDEVDLFSDKATEHDINAYMELKELDNKDAYYMATATKKAIRMLKELQ